MMASSWWILANRAVHRIAKGYIPEKAVVDTFRNAAVAAGLMQTAGGAAASAVNYAEAARLAAGAVGRYFWPAIPEGASAIAARNIWLRRAGRVGAAWAALDVATRLAGPGGMLYDDYGRFNIAGVPFI